MSRASKVSHLRPSVADFAVAMENALRKHDETKGGQSNWRNDPPRRLFRRMLEEALELDREIEDGSSVQILNEAADVANFSMMVADASGRLAEDVQNRCAIRCCSGWATHLLPDDSDVEVCEWHHDLAVEIEDALAKRVMKNGEASSGLLKALERVVAANPAFRVGTIGCPNSESRARQNEQIAAEDEALAAIAEARGLPGLAPLPVPGGKPQSCIAPLNGGAAAAMLIALAVMATAARVASADPVLSIAVEPDGQVWAEYEGDGCMEFGGPFESVGDWQTGVSISESGGVSISQVSIEMIAGDWVFTVYESCVEGTLYRPIPAPPEPVPPPLGAGPGTPLPFAACPFGIAPAVLYVNGAERVFDVIEVCPQESGETVLYCRAAADHDRSGAVNVPDIFAFLGDWFSGSTRADVDASGHATVPDIFVFLAAWFS